MVESRTSRETSSRCVLLTLDLHLLVLSRWIFRDQEVITTRTHGRGGEWTPLNLFSGPSIDTPGPSVLVSH